MSELPEVSRTFQLDDELISRLSSFNAEQMLGAIGEIPEALTRQEIRDIGAQVNRSARPDINFMDSGRRLETDTLFNLGYFLLHHKPDLVSTANIASELKGRGIGGMIGFISLRYSMRKKQKQIIEYLTDPATYEEHKP